MPFQKGFLEYHLTKAGRDLRHVVGAVGMWGQKWIESSDSLRNLDPSLLMWDMRRNLDPAPLPKRRTTVQFLYPELPSSKNLWWLVIDVSGEVDLCWSDPGFEVDLFVTTDLRTMTAIWMGLTTMDREKNKFEMLGSTLVAATMQTWLGLSPFAKQRKLTASPALPYVACNLSGRQFDGSVAVVRVAG